MDSLLFLIGALVLVGLGTAVIALRAREPRGLDHSVKSFRKEMQALSPDSRKGDEIEPIDPLTQRADHPSTGE